MKKALFASLLASVAMAGLLTISHAAEVAIACG